LTERKERTQKKQKGMNGQLKIIDKVGVLLYEK